jgi:hypothetical protein
MNDQPVTTLTRLKLGLAIVGLIVFAWGVRVEQSRLRTIGIAFVAAAWVLRFLRAKARDDVSQQKGASGPDS